jgi:hypothetical protein
MNMCNGLYVLYKCALYLVFLRFFIFSWTSVFHCVTSSGHEVKLRKHGHGVIMRSSLCVIGLEGYGHGCSYRSRGATLGARSSS